MGQTQIEDKDIVWETNQVAIGRESFNKCITSIKPEKHFMFCRKVIFVLQCKNQSWKRLPKVKFHGVTTYSTEVEVIGVLYFDKPVKGVKLEMKFVVNGIINSDNWSYCKYGNISTMYNNAKFNDVDEVKEIIQEQEKFELGLIGRVRGRNDENDNRPQKRVKRE